MKYHVLATTDNGESAIIMSGMSLDFLPDKFRKECVQRVGKKVKELLTKTQFHIIDRYNEHHGVMIWVKAEGHKDPVLMVKLDNRNVLQLYSVKGTLISKDSIE